jgi:hypothetical protein
MVSSHDGVGELTKKLDGLAQDLAKGDSGAAIAAGVVARNAILAAARARAHLKVTDGWVRTRPARGPGSSPAVIIQARGGFAHLAERGSYKKPDGYDIGVKKVTARRRRNAARSGRELTEKRVLASASFGPVTGPVHHPPQRATPFWEAGVVAARPLTVEVWRRAVRRDLAKHFRGG